MPLTSVVKSVFSHVLILTFLKQVLPFSALMHEEFVFNEEEHCYSLEYANAKKTYRIFILTISFAIRRMSVIA